MIMCTKIIHKIFALVLLFSVTLVLQTQAQAADEWIYTVKPGDNLWDLSEHFLVDMRYWRKLQRHNKVTAANFMAPGTKLHIPREWSRIQPSKATVKSFSGEVIAIDSSSGTQQDVVLDMELNAGDEIQTGAESSVTLEFDDGSLLILREESELKFETLESYGDEDVFNTQLKLRRGRSDNQVNPDKKPGSRFEIRTPSATAAVRGTTYRVTVLDQEAMSTEVLEGKVNVANDLGGIGVPGGYGTVAKRDVPPTAPVVLLAAPNLTSLPTLIEQLPIKFNLPKIDNANAYRVQVGSDPTFQTLDHDAVSRTTSTKIAELADGEYLLKIRGIDQNDLEGFDSQHSFVLNAKPEAPFIIAPQSEAAVSHDYRDFSWAISGEISTYHFQLANNAEFDQPLINLPNNQGAATTLTESLEPGKWFWRVAAIDNEEGAGPFGQANPFRVMKPGAKADVQSMNESEITFAWSAGEESDQYQIQVANDSTFEDLIVNEQIDQAEYTLARPENPGTLYVRSKLIEADGFEGSWGAVQQVELPDDRPFWLMGALPFLIFLL